jgi:hypothetical protein
MTTPLTLQELERRKLSANTASGIALFNQIIAVFKERDELKAQLAASQARECRMSEALQGAHRDFNELPQGASCADEIGFAMMHIEMALSASGPCPHKAEADGRLKQLLTQIEMNHAAIREWKAEVERLNAKCAALQKEITNWMAAGEKAGYVFGLAKDGAFVEHNPKLATECMSLTIGELESEVDQLRKLCGEAAVWVQRWLETAKQNGFGEEPVAIEMHNELQAAAEGRKG